MKYISNAILFCFYRLLDKLYDTITYKNIDSRDLVHYLHIKFIKILKYILNKESKIKLPWFYKSLELYLLEYLD